MAKNTSAETTQKSQAANDIKKNKELKVVSLKETQARKEAREKEYRNFRIASLKRRCKRMKLSEEETKKAIDTLIKQMDEPQTYQILMIFNKTDIKMVKEALANAKIDVRILGDYYAWIDGDKTLLDKLREILPPKTKIHPYTKKKPPVLEKRIPDKQKKPTSNTAAKKKAAQLKRKKDNLANLAARKKRPGKVIRMTHKNPSKRLKKAPRTLKKAA